MKHVFIVNPVAGKGKAEEELLPLIKKCVEATGFDYEIHRSLNKNEVASYCRQRAETGEAVRFYACGGDGTLNNVLNGIVGLENAELAIIPCGSGNDFSRNFTNRSNFLDLTRQVNGSVIKVDAVRMITESGEITYAANMLNVGADCDVVVESSNYPKLPGSLAYVVAALKILPQNRLYKLRYEYNGSMVTANAMLCAVGNGAYCGGGFYSCPKSSIVDGLLDVGVVFSCTGMKLLQMMLKYRNGTHLQDKHADKYVNYFQTRRFKLEPIAPMNVSVDGECGTFESTTFEIVPKAINFVLPEGSELK